LNILSTVPYLQAGACSLATSGTTTISEKVITVATHAYRISYCIEDLQKKNLQLVPGSMNDEFDSSFEAVLTGDLVSSIKKAQEKELWVGATASGDLINGIYTNIEALSAQTTISTTTTPAAGTVIGIMAEVVAGISEAMWDRGLITINLSVANYNLYKAALITAKIAYNENIGNVGALEMDYPGYAGQVKVKAQTGLTGKAYIIAMSDSNVYIGTDEVSEVSEMKYVFDEVTDLVWAKATYKLGVQVAFPAEVVANF